MEKVDINNYTIVNICNDYTDRVDFSILLNNKHSVKDFQNAIDKIKVEIQDSIAEYGDDWVQISQKLTDFDFIELETRDTRVYF